MRSALEGAQTGTPLLHVTTPDGADTDALKDQIVGWLEDAKAEDLVAIELAGKSSVADHMLIATGRSDRHVSAIADQIERHLKEHGHGKVRTEGKQSCDWVLVDVGDVIVHIFRPEVREFYNLEKMWSADRPAGDVAH
ncbi:MAG: ribosome silencing factor [Pseudomonadota bacterium]